MFKPYSLQEQLKIHLEVLLAALHAKSLKKTNHKNPQQSKYPWLVLEDTTDKSLYYKFLQELQLKGHKV